MTFDQATRWLQARGGTVTKNKLPDGWEVVASIGGVARRCLADDSEKDIREAVVAAVEMLQEMNLP